MIDFKIIAFFLPLYCVILVLCIKGDGQQTRSLSANDPNSFSNPEDVRAENIHIKWNVDFNKRIVNGSVMYNLIATTPSVDKFILDIRDLNIHSVRNGEGDLHYEIGEAYKGMGNPLAVFLPPLVADSYGVIRENIVIDYETTLNSTALQWLTKEMTQEKKFPFLYSVSEDINARSLFPCQDTPFTKSTFTASVTAPKEAVVLFSAVSTGAARDVGDSKLEHKFIQKVPVPSYLVALVVGQLESAVIGPRSKVWAEKSFIDDAAFDFSETEKMIQAAESIVGKYVWGRYDIAVMPPSFAYGGMENPCLTFATPFLFTHDKSLADVIAHEIAHSWTGNLVTVKNFEHFWLNEGFTVFLERKILGLVRGEKERQFASTDGWTALEDTVSTLGKNSSFTKLIVDLRGVDPDDAWNKIPYEKGSAFLYYLEQKVGGAVAMNAFLRQYVDTFVRKSIDSFDFKNNFIKYFESQGKGHLIQDVDRNYWFYAPGLPVEKPAYDETGYEACTSLAKRWLSWDEEKSTPTNFSPLDLRGFSSSQLIRFLQIFLSGNNTLSRGKVKAMENIYKFNSYRNAEARYRWLRICVRAQWREQVPLALEFVTRVGRMEFIRPLYRDLYAWEEMRAEAISTFEKNIPFMMHVSVVAVSKDLHLEGSDN